MSDLFWPGDERADDLMSEASLLRAMVRVESAWLHALVASGIAGAGAADDLLGLVADDDIPAIAARSEGGGNPVVPLVSLLRERLQQRSPAAASWVHRGLTSQDVLDTALVLCAGAVLARLREEIAAQVVALADLTARHRASLMTGRTLTQHAVPITFGLKAAVWLQGVLDAAGDLDAVGAEPASQFGGAAGTLAAPTELAVLAGLDDAPRRAHGLVVHASAILGLRARSPWHTSRAPLTRYGDALVHCSDAFGRIANDVLTLSRPEIAELAEPTAQGRGASSTMPQKMNPVLSVLIRRAALTAPMAGAQLHLAAAESLDERPDGAWHSEWATLRTLSRNTVIAASHTAELVTGLQVNVVRMRATLDSVSEDVLAERRSLSALVAGATSAAPEDPATYLGTHDLIVEAALARAMTYLQETR